LSRRFQNRRLFLNARALRAEDLAPRQVLDNEELDAKIIFTPTQVVIKDSYNLDLNRDGITDFVIVETHFHTHHCKQGPGDSDLLAVGPTHLDHGNGEVGTAPYAAALGGGMEIGPNRSFDDYYGTMAEVAKGWFFSIERNACLYSHGILGDWVNLSNHYLGLAFQITGGANKKWKQRSTGYW
jgi:hypothetical protein